MNWQFSDDPKKRLRALRQMPENERQEYLRALNPPIHPWPIGMPCSAAPLVVVLGVSPGNSPSKEDRGFFTLNKPGDRGPTFGEKHEGFDYQDTRSYWKKVCSLCCFLVRRYAPDLTEMDCLALSGHLNLGTGQAGKADVLVTDEKITRWVSNLMYEHFQPRLLVCLGLNRIMKARWKIWNHPDGLQVNWHKADFEHPFGRYRFRLWETCSKGNRPVGVLMWPNHLSRHPFAGDDSKPEWKSALKQADAFLTKHDF